MTSFIQKLRELSEKATNASGTEAIAAEDDVAEFLVNNKEAIADVVEALERIERWVGEFPETGRFWENDPARPMSYAACFGSNGERDYMRGVAADALSKLEASQ